MKILLLEDDLELCKVIQAELEKNDYIVDCYNDGETAMLYALNTEYAYDLAIIDRMLPVIHGLTIIKAMRRKGIPIPVIITTGMSAIDERIEGLDGGADDYLVKPFHIRELLARVRALKSQVDVDTLLITLYEAYESICMKKNISLKLDLANISYPTLYTDQERLFQILNIYMDNAVQHSVNNSMIQIQSTTANKEITFFVIDHGQGIAEEDKPFLFNRFFCADKSHSDKSHFGLGLSIAEELAKMLDGTVGFKDTKGGGATFYVTLPIK